MKIIILGAGQVGATLAENLVGEDNDITIVDHNQKMLDNLESKHDLRAVLGKASSPSVLRQAGATDADLLLAVTASDEVNMVACQVAYALFNTPVKVARIQHSEYLRDKDKLFQSNVIPIDHIISPHRLLVEEITRLINYPGTLQVSHIANNLVSIVVMRAYYGGALIGSPISALRDQLPHIDCRIVAIKRGQKIIRPQGSTVVEAGDEITFICATENIKAIMSTLQRLERPYKRMMIIGGDDIAVGVAKKLENQYRIKLLEPNPKRATKLAEELTQTLVFQGDPSDETLLFEENIEETDIFLCLSDDDETNIMSALLAKRLGAKNTMVVISRIAYMKLVQDSIIDIAVSPQQTTVSAMLSLVRKGDVVNAISMRYGIAEVDEIVLHGDENTSQVIGRKVEDLKLPVGTVIAGIVRNGEVLIAKRQIQLQEKDHVIIYINDKKYVPDVEKLFQPSTFFL